MPLHFELVTPAKLVRSEDVHMVVVPGTEGEFGVLEGHAPFMSTIRDGAVQVFATANAAPEIIQVRGGFAEVNPQGLTLLAETAIPLADLDAAALAQQVKDAEEDFADAVDAEAKRKAQENLDHLKALQGAL